MSLIREFVAAVLAEEARTAEKSAANGLALYINKRGMEIELTLYNPEILVDKVLTAREPKDQADAFNYSTVANLLMIKSKSPCNGGWEITNVAAEQGFGPLIHDIAMAVSPTNTVVPDRDHISAEEHSIFSYYFNRRRDVQSKQLDDESDPHTPPETDDCKVYDQEQVHGIDKNPLNYSYSGAKPDIAGLVANHKKTWAKVKAMLDVDADKMHTRFKGGGAGYFNRRYKAVPDDARVVGMRNGRRAGND